MHFPPKLSSINLDRTTHEKCYRPGDSLNLIFTFDNVLFVHWLHTGGILPQRFLDVETWVVSLTKSGGILRLEDFCWSVFLMP